MMINHCILLPTGPCHNVMMFYKVQCFTSLCSYYVHVSSFSLAITEIQMDHILILMMSIKMQSHLAGYVFANYFCSGFFLSLFETGRLN